MKEHVQSLVQNYSHHYDNLSKLNLETKIERIDLITANLGKIYQIHSIFFQAITENSNDLPTALENLLDSTQTYSILAVLTNSPPELPCDIDFPLKNMEIYPTLLFKLVGDCSNNFAKRLIISCRRFLSILEIFGKFDLKS